MKNKKYIIKNKTVSSRSAVLFFIFIIIFSTIIAKLAYGRCGQRQNLCKSRKWCVEYRSAQTLARRDSQGRADNRNRLIATPSNNGAAPMSYKFYNFTEP